MSAVAAPEDNVTCKEPMEVPRDQAIQNLLHDDTLADLTLKGSDGTTVRAHRCMLAARSKFFHRLLYGQFRESDKDVVELGFPGDVLRAIVEHIYSDNPKILNQIMELESKKQDKDKQMSVVKSVVGLLSAAEYFRLPALSKKLEPIVEGIIFRAPWIAGFFFLACRMEETACSTLEAKALDSIRMHPGTALSEDVLPFFSPALLGEVVGDEKLAAEELLVFQCIKTWADGKAGSKDASAGLASKESSQMDYHVLAMQMVCDHVCLEKIDPAVLASVVRSSELVTNDQLLAAFEAQAIEASKEHGISYKKPRVVTEYASLCVCGAGHQHTNGVYALDGEFQGNPKWSKMGTWNDEPCKFILYSYAWKNNARRGWHISAFEPNCDLIPRVNANLNYDLFPQVEALLYRSKLVGNHSRPYDASTIWTPIDVDGPAPKVTGLSPGPLT